MIFLAESSLQPAQSQQLHPAPASACTCLLCAPDAVAVAPSAFGWAQFVAELLEGSIFIVALLCLAVIALHEQIVRLVNLFDWRGADRVILFGFNCLTVAAAAGLVCEIVLALQRHNFSF